jgi:RNA polymerase sigma-70 factor (ECF subfamily)
MSDGRDGFERARAGDAEALDHLVVRHLPSLMAFVRLQAGKLVLGKESLRDLVQSACVEVLRDAAHFDYRGDAAFRRWLFTQALNKIRNKHRHYRAARRDAAREAAPDGSGDANDLAQGYATLCTPSQAAIGREEVARLEAAFERLPPDQRQAVVLRRVVGLSYDQIAEEMGRNEGAVRTLVYRGVARLATLLKAEPPESA